MKILQMSELNLSSSTIVVDLVNEALGDSVADSVYLQVADISGNITIKGRVSDDSGSYKDVAIIDMKDFTIIDKISADGVYVISGEGLSSFQINGTGKITVKVLA